MVVDLVVNNNDKMVHSSVYQVEGFLHKIYIDDIVDDAHLYRGAINIITNANANDIIEVEINTNGGYLDTGKALRHALQHTKAPTFALVHKAYSCGSMIALSCDHLIVSELGDMMIHTAKGGIYGSFEKLERSVKHDIAAIELWVRTIYKHFLTDKELEQVVNGKEFWLTKPQIERRWKIMKNKQKLEKQND